jgi:hypothetical protein
MRTWLAEAVPVVAAALGLIVSSPARCQGNPGDSAADEIADWNKIMFRAAQTAATAPFVMTRVAAIVQVAVFDAVNGIERRYAPVHVAPGAAAGASQRAAAVAAAYTTLVNRSNIRSATRVVALGDQQRRSSGKQRLNRARNSMG